MLENPSPCWASAVCGKLGPLLRKQQAGARKRGVRQACPWRLAALTGGSPLGLAACSLTPGMRKRGVRQAWALGCFAALAASWLLAAWAASRPAASHLGCFAALAASWRLAAGCLQPGVRKRPGLACGASRKPQAASGEPPCALLRAQQAA